MTVNFENAKLLKERGYSEGSKHYYEESLTEQQDPEDGFSGPFGWERGEVNRQSGYHRNAINDGSNKSWYLCEAPEIFDVVMWFWEKHGLWITVTAQLSELPVIGAPELPFVACIAGQDGSKWWFEKIEGTFKGPIDAYDAALNHILTQPNEQ